MQTVEDAPLDPEPDREKDWQGWRSWAERRGLRWRDRWPLSQIHGYSPDLTRGMWPDSALGQRIVCVLTHTGHDLTTLAAELGTSRYNLDGWLRGRVKPVPRSATLGDLDAILRGERPVRRRMVRAHHSRRERIEPQYVRPSGSDPEAFGVAVRGDPFLAAEMLSSGRLVWVDWPEDATTAAYLGFEKFGVVINRAHGGPDHPAVRRRLAALLGHHFAPHRPEGDVVVLPGAPCREAAEDQAWAEAFLAGADAPPADTIEGDARAEHAEELRAQAAEHARRAAALLAEAARA